MRSIGTIAALSALVGCGSSDANFDPVGTGDDGPEGRVDECSAEQPCRLEAEVPATGYIGAEGDQDPYLFEVPSADMIIQVVLTNDATLSPVQLELALFGPGNTAIDNQRAASNRGRQRVEIQLPATGVGEYRLEVRDVGSDNKDDNNPYFLEFRLLDPTDANEPNNEQGAATPIALGTPVSGLIATQGDRDWFSVEGQRGRRFRIIATAPGISGLRFSWSLFDPTGTSVLAESTEPAGASDPWPTDTRTLPTTGRYLLVVEASDPSVADETRLYTVQIDELPEPDVQEGLDRNDTFQTATLAMSESVYNGYLATNGDFDWFAIDVGPEATAQNPMIVTAELSYPARPSVDMQLSMFMPDGRTLICQQRDGDGCKALRIIRDSTADTAVLQLSTAHIVTAPGRYLVLVQDFQGDDIDDQLAYALEVGVFDDPDPRENYGFDDRDDAVMISAQSSTTGATIVFPWIEGHISYADDVDWYGFEIPSREDAIEGMNDDIQNGDWLVQIELQVPGPTPVETNAFFYGERRRYNGFGCQEDESNNCDNPNETCPCRDPGVRNIVDVNFSTTLGPNAPDDDCFVVFRERTEEGPHYWRITDLDRDDFDLTSGGRYRFRMTITAGCPGDSACQGQHMFGEQDLCGRP